jgi:hypothetical protein
LLRKAGENHKEKKEPIQDLMNMDDEELLKQGCME